MAFWAISRADTATPPEPEAFAPAVRSRIRQAAAGFGTVYFLARMLEHQGETLEGKRLIVSGFGNMSWGVCRKAAELPGLLTGEEFYAEFLRVGLHPVLAAVAHFDPPPLRRSTGWGMTSLPETILRHSRKSLRQ